MSDAVLIAIVSGVFSTIALIINLKANKKINTVDKKLDENFKQANGHFTQLLETTSKLAKEEGKQEEKDNPTK